MSKPQQCTESQITKNFLEDTYCEVLDRFNRIKQETCKTDKHGFTLEKITTTKIGRENDDYIEETVIESSLFNGSEVQTKKKHILRRQDKGDLIEFGLPIDRSGLDKECGCYEKGFQRNFNCAQNRHARYAENGTDVCLPTLPAISPEHSESDSSDLLACKLLECYVCPCCNDFLKDNLEACLGLETQQKNSVFHSSNFMYQDSNGGGAVKDYLLKQPPTCIKSCRTEKSEQYLPKSFTARHSPRKSAAIASNCESYSKEQWQTMQRSGGFDYTTANTFQTEEHCCEKSSNLEQSRRSFSAADESAPYHTAQSNGQACNDIKSTPTVPAVKNSQLNSCKSIQTQTDFPNESLTGISQLNEHPERHYYQQLCDAVAQSPGTASKLNKSSRLHYNRQSYPIAQSSHFLSSLAKGEENNFKCTQHLFASPQTFYVDGPASQSSKNQFCQTDFIDNDVAATFITTKTNFSECDALATALRHQTFLGQQSQSFSPKKSLNEIFASLCKTVEQCSSVSDNECIADISIPSFFLSENTAMDSDVSLKSISLAAHMPASLKGAANHLRLQCTQDLEVSNQTPVEKSCEQLQQPLSTDAANQQAQIFYRNITQSIPTSTLGAHSVHNAQPYGADRNITQNKCRRSTKQDTDCMKASNFENSVRQMDRTDGFGQKMDHSAHSAEYTVGENEQTEDAVSQSSMLKPDQCDTRAKRSYSSQTEAYLAFVSNSKSKKSSKPTKSDISVQTSACLYSSSSDDSIIRVKKKSTNETTEPTGGPENVSIFVQTTEQLQNSFTSITAGAQNDNFDILKYRKFYTETIDRLEALSDAGNIKHNKWKSKGTSGKSASTKLAVAIQTSDQIYNTGKTARSCQTSEDFGNRKSFLTSFVSAVDSDKSHAQYPNGKDQTDASSEQKRTVKRSVACCALRQPVTNESLLNLFVRNKSSKGIESEHTKISLIEHLSQTISKCSKNEQSQHLKRGGTTISTKFIQNLIKNCCASIGSIRGSSLSPNNQNITTTTMLKEPKSKKDYPEREEPTKLSTKLAPKLRCKTTNKKRFPVWSIPEIFDRELKLSASQQNQVTEAKPKVIQDKRAAKKAIIAELSPDESSSSELKSDATYTVSSSENAIGPRATNSNIETEMDILPGNSSSQVDTCATEPTYSNERVRFTEVVQGTNSFQAATDVHNNSVPLLDQSQTKAGKRKTAGKRNEFGAEFCTRSGQPGSNTTYTSEFKQVSKQGNSSKQITPKHKISTGNNKRLSKSFAPESNYLSEVFKIPTPNGDPWKQNEMSDSSEVVSRITSSAFNETGRCSQYDENDVTSKAQSKDNETSYSSEASNSSPSVDKLQTSNRPATSSTPQESYSSDFLKTLSEPSQQTLRSLATESALLCTQKSAHSNTAGWNVDFCNHLLAELHIPKHFDQEITFEALAGKAATCKGCELYASNDAPCIPKLFDQELLWNNEKINCGVTTLPSNVEFCLEQVEVVFFHEADKPAELRRNVNA